MGALPPLRHHHTHSDDHGGWAYHTVVADAPHRFTPEPDDPDKEADAHQWFTRDEMHGLRLHPGFAQTMPTVTKEGAHTASVADDPARWEYRQGEWDANQPAIHQTRPVGDYVMHAEPYDTEDDFQRIHVLSPEGRYVGQGYFGDHPYRPGYLEGASEVHPEHRRRGIATGMYNFAEELRGKPTRPATSHTDDAEAFWQARQQSHEAAIDGPDWCTWRRQGQCTFPGTKSQGGSAVAVPVDRGPCPWERNQDQARCPISSPSPTATQFRTGARDDGLVKEARFERTAAWRDVRNKAKRIRREGGVFILVASIDGVGGEVKGDHHVYESMITYVPGSQRTASWDCGCVYGGWAHGPRWNNRPCSHILALRFESQARGMFGKEVQSNTERPDWLTKTTPIHIQYERPSESHPKGRELTRRETPSGNMRTTWHSRSRTRHSSLDPSYSVDMDEPDEDYSYRMQHQAPESDYGAPAHDELPLEAGTSPIPEGHIRLYHYTPHDNVASIREHGLLESHARGDGGLGASNEPSAGTWASTHSPSGGLPTAEDHRAVVEFHAHPEQVSQRAEYPFPNEDPHEWAQRSPHHVIMRGDVAPHQIVAIHEPWHHPTRHLQGRGDLDQFSWLDDPEQNEGLENYTRAYRYLKHQQRTAVKHDSNGPTVAGLALKAADTGRVLMLQRGLDDESDPAAGTWEPPGGHIEPDDPTSLHAGIREWEEETGQPFPTGGVVTHAWTSPNGVYQGHVVVIPKEDQVDLSERQIENPDGDRHEQSAWWDVDDAKKNPALREEAKDTPWAKLTEAGDDAGLKVAGLLCIPAGEGRAHVRIQAQDAGGQNERMRPIPRAEELARPQTDAETLPYSYDDLTEFAEDHPEMTGRQAAVMDPLHSIDEAHPIEPPRHSDSENPGSSGWATSQDPPDWGSINHPDTLLPNADLGGFSANLHDEPEGALPSTDGESDDEDNDFHPTPYDSTSGMATPYEVRTGDSGEGNAAIPDVQSEGTPSSAHVSSMTDTVARFQATAAAQALQEGGGEGGDMGFSTSEIAEAARERLGVSKTAMRDFSSSEQRELIEEGRGKRARNFDRLDIQGTHYSALQDALNAADLHDDDLLIL
jgi:8-oxo-dGTP pyrophosphatase MutT (NUDIX family)/GNAT superfamily N-acetyltransferase